MESKLELWVSVKAFDETDDGYLTLRTSVDRTKVKHFTSGSICTLALTGTYAVVLGAGSTEEKARQRAAAYCRAVECMERK